MSKIPESEYMEYDKFIKDAEPCCNSMDFPDTFEKFVKSYGIKDSKEVYTNGSVLIPVFRVKQWLDHINHCEDRMKYVQETVNTMLNACTTNSIKDKVFRNAARFVQNAIDGQEPDFERIDEPETCGDVVKREAVLNTLDTMDKALDENRTVEAYKELLKECYKELPPVTPKPKTGKWVKYGAPRCGEQHYKCTNCDDYVNFGQYGDYYTKNFKFCPMCGAKMEGESE